MMSEFQRIFNPRAEKAVKAINLLTNGTRYDPTEEEVTNTLTMLKDAVNNIAEVYGALPGDEVEVKDVSGSESRVEASRIDAKVAAIKQSAFARQDVSANVANIPNTQLTAYATHILARLCEKFEEPEAQPKNYLPIDNRRSTEKE